MGRSVFFDSQIIINVSNGVISAAVWEGVVERLTGKYDYCVSFTTFMEIVNALAGGDEDHFEQNRKRLFVLTDVAGSQFLPLPGEFIRSTVLGLPVERPDFSPDQLRRVWMPAIRQAQDMQALTSGSVVMKKLPGGVDLVVGIDFMLLRKQMEDGKKLWGEELRLAKSGKKEMPPAALYAEFILQSSLHAPQTQENLTKVSRALDAAYCHLAHIHHESTKSVYKFENNLQDWIDNQQLMYLADTDITFVTADQRLIAKLGKSVDQSRVMEFSRFAKAG